MRHLVMAAVMVAGALLLTATIASVLQSRAISASNAGTYEPPSATASQPARPSTEAVGRINPEPAVIGVRSRSLPTPRISAAVAERRL